ncbi:MAG: hypothetical protein J2P17_12930 [Mycobacterium sp.]|nr:hypothetical protein [Mycobacterium sp.]
MAGVVYRFTVGQQVEIFVEDSESGALALLTGSIALVVPEDRHPQEHQFVKRLVVKGRAVAVSRDAVPQPPPPDTRERFYR